MNNLEEYLHVFPENSRDLLVRISSSYRFRLKITRIRKSKLGDFRYPLNGEIPVITLNGDSNAYRVLITYLHELAHLIVFLDVGRKRNPHGPTWKKRFGNLLDIFANASCFPPELEMAVRKHLINPKASSHGDAKLAMALRKYDEETVHLLLSDLEEDTLFSLGTKKVFRKGKLRRTRVLCEEVGSRRKYLIHQFAEVSPVNNL